jgi:2-alkyl-3-oxoalkanoate reductase
VTPPVAAVTGGTGFLGRYIVAALAAAGFRVRLLTRRSPMHPLLAEIPLELVLGDLGDPTALSHLVSGTTVVVHAAALVKARNPEAFFAINRDGTRRLAEAVAREAAPPRFILISSQAARSPQLSPYAASKRSAEEAMAAALDMLPWVAVRPCVVYGPWDSDGLAMLRLACGRIAPAIAKPEPRIAMIHARDAAAAVAALSLGPELGHSTFEISDARRDGYGWTELLQAIGGALGRTPRLLPVPDFLVRAAGAGSDGIAALSGHATIFGSDKAREILHRDWAPDQARQLPAEMWTPQVDLVTGLAETVAWWKSSARG